MKTQTTIIVFIVILAALALLWWGVAANREGAPVEPTDEEAMTEDNASEEDMDDMSMMSMDESDDMATDEESAEGEDMTAPTTDETATPAPTPEPATAPETATITYTGSSFSPAQVTIAKGGTVTWVNQSAGGMWIASNNHPTHTLYSGTTRSEHCAGGTAAAGAFDACGNRDSYSFTFEKSGTWRFHNHLNPGVTGTVIVE